MTSFSCYAALLGGVLLLAGSALEAQAGGPPTAPKATINPLMPGFNQPIAFGKATKADVQQATTTAIANTKMTLTAIYIVPMAKRTFANTMLPLDALNDNFSSVYGPISILFNASPDSAVRNQAQRSIALLSKYSNELELDEKLYRAVKDYSNTKEAQALTGPHKKFLTETVDEYERNGFALTPEKRQELQKLNDKIADLSLAFGANIAKDKSFLLVNEADLKGLPDDYIKSRPREGAAYRINVDGPAYSTFM
jgi:thimet oligopeptidase